MHCPTVVASICSSSAISGTEVPRKMSRATLSTRALATSRAEAVWLTPSLRAPTTRAAMSDLRSCLLSPIDLVLPPLYHASPAKATTFLSAQGKSTEVEPSAAEAMARWPRRREGRSPPDRVALGAGVCEGRCGGCSNFVLALVWGVWYNR